MSCHKVCSARIRTTHLRTFQTASGSGLGFGRPLTKRSGWAVHAVFEHGRSYAVLITVVLRAITSSA